MFCPDILIPPSDKKNIVISYLFFNIQLRRKLLSMMAIGTKCRKFRNFSPDNEY